MKYLAIFLLLTSHLLPCHAQLRVGDPGITFDTTKYDPDYPAMLEWQQAGVQGGIPFLASTYQKTIGPTNSDGLTAAIDEVANQGGGQIRLTDGAYTIDKEVQMKDHVRLVGESKAGVVLTITMSGTGRGIAFLGTAYAGLDNLTIQGGYGEPPPYTMDNLKPDFEIVSVYFNSNSANCWLDNVAILNSGKHALSIWKGSHITVRDCHIEGAWNKGGGGMGYVQFSGDHCLMYNTTVKKMRHIILQREGCQYNVLYQNQIEQDVNFHNADAGYNLVEQNISRLPAGLPGNWYAMMGPWSVQHNVPGPGNAVYKNDCIEHNNGDAITFSDTNLVYIPARHEQNSQGPFDTSTNTPIGGTLYPIMAGSLTSSESMGSAPPVTVFPNPFSSGFTLSNCSRFTTASLYDLQGRLIESRAVNHADQLRVSLSEINISTGCYILRLEGSKPLSLKILRIP